MFNMNKPNCGKLTLDEVGLREAYKVKTDLEIAADYGVSGVLVSYYRKKWGIPTISARQRQEAATGRTGPSLDDLTPAMLQSLYTQMGERGIAALYGVAKPAISRLRDKWGIQAITKTDRATRGDIVLSDVQKEVVLGTLLGDGHLDERGVLRVSHAFHQVDYLRRIQALLAPLSKPLFYEEKSMLDGVVCFTFGFSTVQHPWLRDLHKQFYPSGVKVFPMNVLDSLTVRSLAYWYQDDGHRDESSNLPSFALGDITEDAALDVARRVGVKFGFDTFIAEHSLKSSCKSLRIRAASKDMFFQVIKEFVTPDMLHKLPDIYRSGVPILGRTYTLEPKLPKSLIESEQSWPGATQEIRGKLLDDLVAFWTNMGFPYPSAKAEEILIVRELHQEHLIQDGVIKNRHAGQSSCHAFAKHIWEATSFGSRKSPRALFDDSATLRATLEMLLDAGKLPSASNVRSGLRYLRRSGVYNFRPSAAKVLTDRYCRPGGTVFDPCAGYGGRLFGVLLSDARPRYIACEPQPETFTRLHDLRDWMDTYMSGIAGRVNLHNTPAEDFTLDREVDMVLTSPPYWKREVYGTESTQSGVRYPTYEGWLSGFWKPVLTKCVRALRDGGWIVLNVDDFTLEGARYELIADTRRIMSDLGMGDCTETFKYAMPTGTNPDNHEMVLCWTRGVLVNTPVELGLVERFSRCSKCGKGTPEGSLVNGQCAPCTEKESSGMDVSCKGCGITFHADRSDHLFHDENCRVRWNRAQDRLINPAKTTRTFTCTQCKSSWVTEEKGQFKMCPPCRVRDTQVQIETKRTKTCTYRHCGKIFTDQSQQNSSKFCAPECGRREKMFRCGKATDESYFRVPGGTGERTCITCKATFHLAPGEKVNRCGSCRSATRDKACRKCGVTYRDESDNNTRRYCSGCKPE